MKEPMLIRIKLATGWGIQVMSEDPDADGMYWLKKLGENFAGMEVIKHPSPFAGIFGGHK